MVGPIRHDEDALRALMIRYQDGELDAFDRLYAMLAPTLRQYLVSLSRSSEHARDLLQDTFLQLHRSRHTYNPSRPVKPWAFATARHRYLMDRRRCRRKPDQNRVSAPMPDVSVLPEVTDLSTREEVRRAMARLVPHRCEAVLLHHVWGFTFDEIAAMLGIRAGAARIRASRGIADLRGLLKEAGGHHD